MTPELLEKVAKGEITPAEAMEQMKAASQKPITFKVGDKGGVSVYGLQRFPVTLYAEQWERLLDHGGELRNFIAENKGRLKAKD